MQNSEQSLEQKLTSDGWTILVGGIIEHIDTGFQIERINGAYIITPPDKNVCYNLMFLTIQMALETANKFVKDMMLIQKITKSQLESKKIIERVSRPDDPEMALG